MKRSSSYFGSKRGSGSFQQIVNEIPPIKTMVVGFLGNCPLFEYCRDLVDTYGFEKSEKVIKKYWSVDEPGHIVNLDILCAEGQSYLYALAKEGTFFYFDPPYLMSTRKYQAKVYDFEFTDEQHLQFLKLAKSIPARVAISCYDSILYKNELKGWRKKTWRVGTSRGAATVTLYMNYPVPDSLFTYDFLGVDKTDRQRIKRKLKRIQNKILQLPLLERQAILSTIDELRVKNDNI